MDLCRYGGLHSGICRHGARGQDDRSQVSRGPRDVGPCEGRWQSIQAISAPGSPVRSLLAAYYGTHAWSDISMHVHMGSLTYLPLSRQTNKKEPACNHECFWWVLCRYAKTDAASLAYLRRELLRPRYSATETAVGVTVVGTVAAGFSLLDQPILLSNMYHPLFRSMSSQNHLLTLIILTFAEPDALHRICGNTLRR